MKKLKPSTRYKKDLKRIAHDTKKMTALIEVLNLLENEIPIPPKYFPHMLSGDFSGFMECHVLNDLLLIWIDPQTDTIELVRLGSHSELFGKNKKR